MGFFALKPPAMLGTRIAAMTLIALLAVQAMNAAAFLLLPHPEMPVYSARRLIEKVEEAVPAIFAAQETERQLLAEQAGVKNNLRIRWQLSKDQIQLHPPTYASSVLDRVPASLEKDFREKVRTVVVLEHGGPRGPDHHGYRHLPPEFRKQLPSGPIEPNESDSPLFGPFEILIQGLDGGWASIEPQWHPRFSSFLHPWFVTLIGAVILVSVLSAFTATRSLKSLHRLVEAAEKLGRTREATAIDAAGTSSGSLPLR